MAAEDYVMLILAVAGSVYLFERPTVPCMQRALLVGLWSFASMMMAFNRHWHALGAWLLPVFLIAGVFSLRYMEEYCEKRTIGGIPCQELGQDEAGS